MSVDWEEVKRLAADFQRIQLSSSVQRLSERNCIEIINWLLQSRELEVAFTTDGKEYVTHQHIQKEIYDELHINGGRVNLVEIAKALNLDLNIITIQVSEIQKQDPNITVVLGQLISDFYIKHLAEEINESLAQRGHITVGELTRQYDLPSDYLQKVLQAEVGKTIDARQDKRNSHSYYTEAFVARNKACIRGALAGITRPISVSTLVNLCDIPEYIFQEIFASLEEANQVLGSMNGLYTENAMFIPNSFYKAQTDWIDYFYKQNGYLEYDSLTRLEIANPEGFITKYFQKDKPIMLHSCAVSPNLFNQIELSINDVIRSGSWLDLQAELPSAFESEDAEEILKLLKKKGEKNISSVHIFCGTIILTEQFLQKVNGLFEDVILKKAKEFVSSGSYLQMQTENKVRNTKIGIDDSNTKQDRREERRKRAASGKVGGGAQGRETKTKSVKKKNFKSKSSVPDDSDEDNFLPSKNKQNKMNLISVKEIKEIILKESSLQDEENDELISEITDHIFEDINKRSLEAAAVEYESSLTENSQKRKKVHTDLQDKLNTVNNEIHMYDKGIHQFSNKDTQQQLAKYLLKTICSDITNDIFQYVAQENMIYCDQSKELSNEARTKILNDLPNEVKDPLSKLQKSLNSSIDEFMSCLDAALGPNVCDMILRKPDKKKERPILHAHHKMLQEQLVASEDPAMVLHLTSLILFQVVTQTMLHASGRFVPQILSLIQTHAPEETYVVLHKYHDMVLELLANANSKDSENEQLSRSLKEEMNTIKDIAYNFKKQ